MTPEDNKHDSKKKKKIINTSRAKLHTIIPGCAIVLSINWHNNKLIQILNIYTPNNLNEHQDFGTQSNLSYKDKTLRI